MEILRNLDLLSVGVAVAAITILGFTAYFNNRQSVTNRVFLFFCLITVFWSIANYAAYKALFPEITLRLVMFFAVWQTFSFYTFSVIFPSEQKKMSRLYKFVFLPLTIAVSLLTLTPFVFKNIEILGLGRESLSVENGPGIFVFGIFTLFFITSSIINLWKRKKEAKGETRKQFGDVFLGILSTFSPIFIFGFIFPAFLGNQYFVPFMPIFLLPFAFSSFYAIYKHHLFNIRIISVSLLSFLLSLLVFAEVIFTENKEAILLKIGQLFLTLIVTTYLIKITFLQVKQKEEIGELAVSLDYANEKLNDLNQNLEKKVEEQVLDVRRAYEVEKKARGELEKLNAEKDRFVLSTQHNLRTPLTVIKGFLEVALHEEKEPQTRSHLEKATKATEEIVALTNNLLKITERKVKDEITNT